LGMTFRFFAQGPQLKLPIAGAGQNGAWAIKYATDEAVLDEKLENENEILFFEKKIHSDSAQSLLDNPFLILPSPEPGDQSGWHALFGPDIYAKISLHCFRCASGRAESVRHRFAAPYAVAWIAKNYPAPEAQILRELPA